MSGDENLRWLIWSDKHGAWWRPAQRGYTPRIEEAGRYPGHIAKNIEAEIAPPGQKAVAVLSPESVDVMIGRLGEIIASIGAKL